MVSIEAILANIRRLKKLIEQTQDEIQEEEDFLLDLESFLSATRFRQDAYYDNQYRRNSELDRCGSLCVRVRTADVFSNGMHTMLNGPKHNAAAGNFDIAISKINTAIRDCKERIADLKKKLRRYEAELAEWQAMLRSAQLA